MKEQIKIHVMPKVQFHEVLEKNNISDINVDEFIRYAFICINDTNGQYYYNSLFTQNHSNVLNLWFDDIEHDGNLSPTNKEETKAFTNEQANQIVNFLDSNKGIINTLLVHCAAGISRSGAVGRFALDYLNGDREYFKLNNNHILPNGRVLRMLNEAWRIKKSKKYD
jgi:predicted protein tyrosine phosphatase